MKSGVDNRIPGLSRSGEVDTRSAGAVDSLRRVYVVVERRQDAIRTEHCTTARYLRLR